MRSEVISGCISDFLTESSGTCTSVSDVIIDEVFVDTDLNGITLVADIIAFVVVLTAIGDHCRVFWASASEFSITSDKDFSIGTDFRHETINCSIEASISSSDAFVNINTDSCGIFFETILTETFKATINIIANVIEVSSASENRSVLDSASNTTITDKTFIIIDASGSISEISVTGN